MRSLKKNKNHQSEEEFHNEWAESVFINDVDVIPQFNGITSPEYKEVMKLAGTIKGKKVLNVGCGLGEEAVYLAIKGANVTAIDISKKMLEKTKILAKRYNVDKKIRYYHMPIEHIRFKTGSFDAVVGCNILHHVEIKKAIKEIKKMLKKGGVAVFSEPLIYNPIINIYRIMASKVRTAREHPLTYSDLNYIRSQFKYMSHKEFHFFTLLIFVWFFVGERQHPNKTRYWKKIITEGDKYKIAFKVLYCFDIILFKIFPFLKRYCWVTVIKVIK